MSVLRPADPLVVLHPVLEVSPMSTDTESFEDVTCIRETEKAILVRLDDAREVWVPKSVVHDDSEVYEDGGTGELVLKRWWSEKEGLS